MELRTIYVGFDGHHVAVRSNIPEVLATVERDFLQMIAAEPARTVASLEVHRQGRDGHGTGGDEANARGGIPDHTATHVKRAVINRLIQARPDLLWLHAGGAVHGGSAVIIPGASGQGKSTLVTNLCAGGWTYLSDDLVALDSATGRVLAFPQTPAVRSDPGEERPSHRLSELRKTVVTLSSSSICREPVPIAALVFPTYSLRLPSALVRCSPATAMLQLLENCVNFLSHREEAVRYFADLVRRVPVSRLTYSSGRIAAELIARAHEEQLALPAQEGTH